MISTSNWPCAALPGASLASRTTLKVGGEVAWLLEPSHPEEMIAAWNEARSRGYTPRVLGGGANLLVADGLHDAVVIATERMSRVFRPRADQDPYGDPEEGDDNKASAMLQVVPTAEIALDRERDPRLVAWAGAGMPGLVRIARDLGWTGIEGLAGVPGQVGGGVAMNAGGRWGDLWDVIESVRLLLPDGTEVIRERADHSPSYRNGNLEGALVLGAVLKLEVGNKAQVKADVQRYLQEKNAVQPVTERSCGCVFKNPDPEESGGRTAGQLVDDCGLKGTREGEAMVSEKHGNFVINRGGATATDVLDLIARVRAEVASQTGVELQREVQLWDPEADS